MMLDVYGWSSIELTQVSSIYWLVAQLVRALP